jgi:hypothetical protein
MTERRRKGSFGTLFAFMFGMTSPFRLALFGDTYVEETPHGTLVLRKGDKTISPHEYAYVWTLAPRVAALCRVNREKIDLVFESGLAHFGAFYAYNAGPLGENEDRYLIAALVVNGTLILDDEGHYKLFVPNYPKVETLYGRFLVMYRPEGIVPYVQIYDLDGNLIAEGAPLEAREKVHKKWLGS